MEAKVINFAQWKAALPPILICYQHGLACALAWQQLRINVIGALTVCFDYKTSVSLPVYILCLIRFGWRCHVLHGRDPVLNYVLSTPTA